MKPTEEEFFKDLISKSKLEINSPGFEQQIMMNIKRDKMYQQNSVPLELKLSWLFLALIIVLGITTTALITHLQVTIFGISLQTVKSLFDLIFIVFVLLQLDSLIKYTYRLIKFNMSNPLRYLKDLD